MYASSSLVLFFIPQRSDICTCHALASGLVLSKERDRFWDRVLWVAPSRFSLQPSCRLSTSLNLTLFTAGAGLGGVILPLMINGLLRSVGLRWTLRFFGGFFFVVLGICTYFARPRVIIRAPTRDPSEPSLLSKEGLKGLSSLLPKARDFAFVLDSTWMIVVSASRSVVSFLLMLTLYFLVSRLPSNSFSLSVTSQSLCISWITLFQLGLREYYLLL